MEKTFLAEPSKPVFTFFLFIHMLKCKTSNRIGSKVCLKKQMFSSKKDEIIDNIICIMLNPRTIEHVKYHPKCYHRYHPKF